MLLLYFFLSLILFVLFTPGVLMTLSFSKNSKKITVALTHGILFSIVWTSICYFLKNQNQMQTQKNKKEGFTKKTKKGEDEDESFDTNEESSSSSSSKKEKSETTETDSPIAKNTVSRLLNGDVLINNFNESNIAKQGRMVNITIPSGTVDNINNLTKK